MKHKILISIVAMLATSMALGVTLNYTPVGVPPDGQTRNRNASVVSDGTYIYYTPGEPSGAGAYFYRIQGGNNDSSTWANLTALYGNAGGVQDGGRSIAN